jgi:hypothetical protein
MASKACGVISLKPDIGWGAGGVLGETCSSMGCKTFENTLAF